MRLPTILSRTKTWFISSPTLLPAGICFLLALGLIVLDRIPAATLTAGLFVVLVLLHYLPQMESFKAYGVEAKWRARLDEADEILRKLRQSAVASASLTYHTLGWGSRIGGGREKEKQGLSDRVDATLRDLNVTEEQIYDLKYNYLRFSVLDLFSNFTTIAGLCVFDQMKTIEAELKTIGEGPDSDMLRERRQKLAAVNMTIHQPKPDHTPPSVFRTACHGRIPRELLTSSDVAVLDEFADRIADLEQSCTKNGRVPDEACDLIDTHGESALDALSRPYSTDLRDDTDLAAHSPTRPAIAGHPPRFGGGREQGAPPQQTPFMPGETRLPTSSSGLTGGSAPANAAVAVRAESDPPEERKTSRERRRSDPLPASPFQEDRVAKPRPTPAWSAPCPTAPPALTSVPRPKCRGGRRRCAGWAAGGRGRGGASRR